MTPELDIAVETPAWTTEIPDLADLVRRVVEACLGVCPAQPGAHVELSFLFCDAQTIRTLNATWRNQDKPTNVLSFPAPAIAGGPFRPLGDVALSFETVASEALSENKTLADHTAHLIAHGVLHLLGFDHETDAEAEQMEALERAALARLGLPDPYATQIRERQ